MSEPERLFTLTPLNPVYETPPSDDGKLHARAFVNFRNVHLLAFGGSGSTMPSLKTLSAENWIYFSSTSAAPADEDDTKIQNWERSSLMEISLQVINAQVGRQLLLRVHLMSLGENGRVRVAIDRVVQNVYDILNNENTTISLLLPDPPERQWIYVDVKHIRRDNGEASALRVKEVAGFLV